MMLTSSSEYCLLGGEFCTLSFGEGRARADGKRVGGVNENELEIDRRLTEL
jgi:hypothetical protein